MQGPKWVWRNALCEGVSKHDSPVPCRGVACYIRNSAQRAARWGFCRTAACYALRRKAHKKAMAVFCRGVACYARNSVRNACRRRGVNHHSAPLVRIAGVARYAPTEEGKMNAEKGGAS